MKTTTKKLPPLKIVYNAKTGRITLAIQTPEDLIETKKLNDELNAIIAKGRITKAAKAK